VGLYRLLDTDQGDESRIIRIVDKGKLDSADDERMKG
jgi:hypothetical protein